MKIDTKNIKTDRQKSARDGWLRAAADWLLVVVVVLNWWRQMVVVLLLLLSP